MSSTTQHIEQIGQQTLDVLSQRKYRFVFWRRDPHAELRDKLRSLVQTVRAITPAGFTADQFEATDRLLGTILTALEAHFARAVDGRDTVTCQWLNDGINALRDAKEWIAQGLSPDPARRPSDEALRALGNESALRALTGVVPPKQPVLPI